MFSSLGMLQFYWPFAIGSEGKRASRVQGARDKEKEKGLNERVHDKFPLNSNE
jgi:hypothetical protein